MASLSSILRQSYIFGLNAKVNNNISFIDENLVLYPCGHNVIIYNIESKDQTFIKATNSSSSRGITALSISSNKKYVAIAEMNDKAIISIYDVNTLRRRKILQPSQTNRCRFTHIAFSADDKYLLTQSGEPELLLTLWSWEKAKAIASIRSSNSNGNPITQVQFCPQESSLISVTGQNIIKFLRLNNGQLRLQPLTFKRDTPHFISHTWLDAERIVATTLSEELWLFENCEFRGIISSPYNISMHSIIPYSKGFICSGEKGTIRFYEKCEDAREHPRLIKSLPIQNQNKATITSLAISPSEDLLLCSLSNNQIFSLNLSNIDILKEDANNFEIFNAPFHAPGRENTCEITGVDTCIRKPLVATCGVDCSVRIWNFMERSLELMKVFDNPAYSISFHPSGLHLMVGFSDKLRFLNILMDDICCAKEFEIKRCEEVQFSNGGQYFAAVQDNVIHVYHSYSYELIITLRGHISSIQSVKWHLDDRKVVSCGFDGSIYSWILRTGQKDGEGHMNPDIQYTNLCMGNDGKSVIVTSLTDRYIRQLDVESGIVSNEISTSPYSFGPMTISPCQKFLFAGSAKSKSQGILRVFKLPIESKSSLEVGVDYVDYFIHGAALTGLCLSHNNKYLFSTSIDGSISICETSDALSNEVHSTLPYAEEILVRESELRDKNELVQDLKDQVEELVLQNEYQLRVKDMSYTGKINEITEKFEAELEQGRKRYAEMQDDKQDMGLEYEDKLKELEKNHEKEVEELQRTYEGKINMEKERVEKLKRDSDEQKTKYEEENQQLVESHTQFLAEMTTDYDQKIQNELDKKKELLKEKEEIVARFEDQKSKIEEDADIEVEELKVKYSATLNSEHEVTLRLKGENGIMKKKYGALQKDIETQKDDICSLQDREKELLENIKVLEKDSIGHEKEIHEREETIHDKEQRIYDLKKKNQELEKFKFVLDYKIKELKRQIEPRENEISELKKQIEDMDQELEQYHRSNASLALMISELKLKMEGMQKESNHQQEELSTTNKRSLRIFHDMQECLQVVNEPKALKACIIDLYKKYSIETSNKSSIRNQKKSSETKFEQEEQNRQREYLEKSVESLKHKISKDFTVNQNEYNKLMRENTVLTTECNQLRRELHSIEVEQLELEKQNQNEFEEKEDTKKNMILKKMAEKNQKKIDELESELSFLQKSLDENSLQKSQSNTDKTNLDIHLPQLVKSKPLRYQVDA